jgi:hypothetical protein
MARSTRRRNITGKRKRSLGGNKDGRLSRKVIKFTKGSTKPRPSALRHIYARGELRRREEEEEELRRQSTRRSQSTSRKTPSRSLLEPGFGNNPARL